MRERRLIMNRNIRDYEVSVWTLQDSFITVLKHSGTDNKGRIEEPDFDLKNDGTLTFKFSIPMYLKENNVKIENPIWYNTTNGNIIADLRKIKVIFHKNTEYEHIFELLITKVTESHEGFQLTCDVECESLAFHELGKSGYKLSLNQDTFIDYWTKWANGEITGNEPKSNIKFWSDRLIEGTDWECEVQMDWSGYDTSRASNIIYEDAYAAAWDVSNEDKFIPTTVVQSKEKERLIDVEESNRYNITQTIAETFGVHCRYEYEHDNDYHITARKIIFYNAFVQEALGPIDINYAYDTTDISREMDSKDTITKMYVKTLTDSNTESGLATIADTAANKSQEDYLLNFDYLYSIGTISQEQYDAVESYEIKMHQLNEELKGYERQINALENQKIDAAAAEAVAKNAVSLDNERISANNDLLNAITNNTGVVHVTATRPDTCAIIRNNNNNSYITLRQKGIVPTTIHIYENFAPGAINELSNEIISYTLNYDEFGNLTKISNITSNSENTQIVYLIYDYEPRLYYENILKTWEIRLARDTNEQQFQEQVLENLDAELTNLNTIKENKLNEKRDAIKHFERLMGPAIREGYWQPEDEYAKYGERYEENLILNNSSKLDDNLFSIGWDNILFDEEDTNYYEIELTQSQEYYPCIRLSNLNIFNSSNYDLNQISFIYQDAAAPASTSTDDIRYLRFLPIGSQCQLRFIHLKNSSLSAVEPVLMLTGLKNVSYNIFDITNYPNTHPRIGVLTTNTSSGSISSNITTLIDETAIRSNLISGIENYEMVYPRIQINSANLKVSEDSLVLKYGNIVLNNYEDYYILGRTDSITNIFKYYITIKPEQLFQKTGYGSYKLLCELSNAGLFMYLDAVQVMKENAYPRVSYEIKPTFVNDEFIRYAYKYLNYIVHINDPELKFEYVKGYITELHLKLDSPKDDTITIDNYKTKFEDLFSTIVVQTEEMKKNSTLIGMAAQAFTPTGGLQADLVQTVMDRVDLNYAFNNGTLTINEEDGIWGTSDSGVVAFRGGGIFTATEKDDNDEWIWNTGILPSGINASLITTGQLDTNLIRIFAGDDLKLQMNGDGLFAYRSQWSNDNGTIAADATRADGLDLGQYVVHNGDGLFLTAEAGTIIGEDENHNPVALENKVDRVSITWNGLTLRNWNNDRTLWADADTGNLTVEGTIRAKELLIIDENSGSSTTDIDTYINGKIADNPSDFLTVNSETITNLQNQIDGEIDTWFYVGAPSYSVPPENEWSSNEEKHRHEGDIYYDIGNPAQTDSSQSDYSQTAGQAWRYIRTNDVYSWSVIGDTNVTAALAAAAEAKTTANNAQNTADSKIRTFYASQKDNVVEKTPNIENINFNDGDLWVNASDNNNLYRYDVINQQWIKADKKIIQIERQYKRWHPTNFGWGPPMDEETADADNPAGAPDTGKRWEELLYGGANNEKTSSQNAGITKWSTDYPGFLDKILYSWIQADPKEKFYPDITIEDENYVVYTRNKITWDDNTITYTVPQLNMNLNDTEVKTFNIKNGNDNGIDFSIPSTNNNATVQINRDVGIKVTDDNQNYFQVTATQMGFFDNLGNARLGFDTNNKFFVDGKIIATEGSDIAGWNTTSNAIYKGSSSFNNANGLYFGDNGLSIGQAFKVSASKQNNIYNFESFTLGTQENGLYPLAYQYDSDTGKYVLSLNNVEFSSSTIEMFNNIATSTTRENNNLYIAQKINGLPLSVADGSLGVVYNNSSSSSTSGSGSLSIVATDYTYPRTGYAGHHEYAGTNMVFGFSTTSSTGKIFYNSQMAYAAESVASGFQNYYRVGRGRERADVDNPEHYCSAVAGGYFTVQNNNILQNTRLQLTFNYSSDIVSGTPDHNCKANTPRNPITIYFWASNSISNKPTLYNTQQYANPITLTGPDKNENKTISFTREIATTRIINENEVLWVIFFSDNWDTLIYVDLATLSLTNPNASQSSIIITSPIGLYVRSNDQWVLAADGTSGSSGGSSSSINMDSGTITNFTNTGSDSKTVNFSKTFTSIPKVFCQYIPSNSRTYYLYSLCVQNVTTTSFTVYSMHDSWSADWVAMEI